MEQKFTHHDTLGLQDVVKLGGDLLLLPEHAPQPFEEARALALAGVIKPSESSIYAGVFDAHTLARDYCETRWGMGKEPEWIDRMPMSVRTWMRLEYAMTEEDAFKIVGQFPYTGLSYMTIESGLIEAVFRAFKMWRLDYIKQLGFLTQPIYNNYSSIRQSLSESTRGLHSLDAMAIGTVMAHNLGFGELRMNNFRALCYSHDAAMPAGGDSVKLRDPAALDEEANYIKVIDAEAFAQLEKDFGIDRAYLIDGVRNIGIDGELLDIADKLAYIARDVSKTLHHLEAGAQWGDQLGMRTLLAQIERFPYVCSIWDDVQVQDEHAVFTDIRRLVAFLKVRLLMFRELYYNPTARFGEYLMSRLFVNALYKSGDLTNDRLRSMADYELLSLIDQKFGAGHLLDHCSSDYAHCDAFKTFEEADAFITETRRNGCVFAMMDDDRLAIKPGTSLRIWTKGGSKTLAEADPGSAQELHEMATMLPLVHVYWLDRDPDLSPEALELLKTGMSA